MKIGGRETCSITSFLVVKACSTTVDEDEIDEFIGEDDDQYCELCNAVKVLEPRSAQSICLTCGETNEYMVPDTSFREGVSIHTPYLYKRSNHFRDHLKRVQGRESTQIEAEVLEKISQELAKTYNHDELHKVTPKDIRLILKQLGLSRLYNHTTRIWCLTTDQEPLVLSQTQEGELLHLFNLIQAPWERLRPEGRSNMLSYSYLIHKMARLLGYPHVAARFSLLKSKDKMVVQDQLWKTICQELGFRFERSV
ncbi:poxvirus late transcription factor VLTF3 like-domain-containing protein [Tribonema minus]|uniref:Poxvirus late transcription factor VLTF3 like-domain-containing protein n=1 Tax=Tribonema minus TaxID=303371 RepID=A0A835YYM5_9STRA|nr:poxvirus late transcription factor VLTF3 like-domain-containing protein [Tribonema minus]